MWVTELGIALVILFPAALPGPPGPGPGMAPPGAADGAQEAVLAHGTMLTIGTVLTLLPAAFLWLRHRFPLAVLLATLGLYCVVAFGFPYTPGTPLTIALAVATYAYAVVSSRKRTVVVALGLIVATVTVAILSAGSDLLELRSVQIGAAVGLGAALGDGTRSRRAYIAEITARAVNAEAARESETARRVSEERLRIARDLHDVVAHQISVISLNAGLASSSLKTDPDRAGEALSTIRSAVRQVLGEIGDLLSVLRSDEELPRSPQPGLEQIPDLCDDFARSGLRVDVRYEGDTPELSPTTDLVAFWVLQEALTNALKHGSEREAHVRVVSQPGSERIAGDGVGTGFSTDTGSVKIVVTNRTRGSGIETDPLSGHGLQGIRERVASVRGQVTSECSAGVFRVSIELPSVKSGASQSEQSGQSNTPESGAES